MITIAIVADTTLSLDACELRRLLPDSGMNPGHRRVLGEDHPNTLAAAFHLVCALSELGEHHAARELNDDIIARRRRVLGDDHPETIMAGAFDLILRGLDIGGEPEWMAALREANKRRQQEARELNEDEPG